MFLTGGRRERFQPHCSWSGAFQIPRLPSLRCRGLQTLSAVSGLCEAELLSPWRDALTLTEEAQFHYPTHWNCICSTFPIGLCPPSLPARLMLLQISLLGTFLIIPWPWDSIPGLPHPIFHFAPAAWGLKSHSWTLLLWVLLSLQSCIPTTAHFLQGQCLQRAEGLQLVVPPAWAELHMLTSGFLVLLCLLYAGMMCSAFSAWTRDFGLWKGYLDSSIRCGLVPCTHRPPEKGMAVISCCFSSFSKQRHLLPH